MYLHHLKVCGKHTKLLKPTPGICIRLIFIHIINYEFYMPTESWNITLGQSS